MIIVLQKGNNHGNFSAKRKGRKTETIKTVNAQYGYKPEHSLLREQVGAVVLAPNAVEILHISSTARQGLSDPAAGFSTLNDMSVEGSTPLSHTFIDNNEKAAVAISDVTDYLNISPE